MTDRAQEWKMVPVEPTEAMKLAGGMLPDAFKGTGAARGNADRVYRAMLAAAPSAPPPPSGAEGDILALRADMALMASRWNDKDQPASAEWSLLLLKAGAAIDKLYAAAPPSGEGSGLRKALWNIVLNARVIPDPTMNGTTDVYAVPLDDVEAARRALVVSPSPDSALRVALEWIAESRHTQECMQYIPQPMQLPTPCICHVAKARTALALQGGESGPPRTITRPPMLPEGGAQWETDVVAYYKSAPADTWTPHDGGPCPVGQESRVFVRFRDGFKPNKPYPAGTYNWGHEANDPGDIIAYRLVPHPDQKERDGG